MIEQLKKKLEHETLPDNKSLTDIRSIRKRNLIIAKKEVKLTVIRKEEYSNLCFLVLHETKTLAVKMVPKLATLRAEGANFDCLITDGCESQRRGKSKKNYKKDF